MPARGKMGRRLLTVLCGAMAWAGSLPVVAQDDPPMRASDHVLVLSQEPGAAERVLGELGFTVRAGQTYPEGITSSTVVFGDWSYLELLYFADPDRAVGNAQAQAELAFVAQGPGVNSMAIQVADLDAAAAQLRKAGFAVADAVAELTDPDGPDGPTPPQPASWRDFHFADSPVAGVELFFIEYPPEQPGTADAEARFRARTTHANGAARLSATWVLVPDLEAESAVYARMGFSMDDVVRLEHLNGRAQVARLGEGAVVLVESDGLPAGFKPAARRGPRVIGLSFEVATLASAAGSPVDGPLGPARQVQTTDLLGFFVEFHEKPAP